MAAAVQDNKTTTGQRFPSVHGYVTAPIYQPYEDGLLYHEVHSHSQERSAFLCLSQSICMYTYMYAYIDPPTSVSQGVSSNTFFLCMLYSSFPSNLGRRLSPPRRSGELSSQMTPQNFSWDLSGVTVRCVNHQAECTERFN